jgi:hypothetical protein
MPPPTAASAAAMASVMKMAKPVVTLPAVVELKVTVRNRSSSPKRPMLASETDYEMYFALFVLL